MAGIYEQKNRVIFPRWRDFKSTSSSGDIRPFQHKPVRDFQSENIEDKISNWETNKDMASAVDLINSSFNLGIKDSAKAAAEFILQKKKNIPSGLNRIINSVLNVPEKEILSLTNTSFDKNIINKYFHEQIAKYRQQVTNYPYNPVAWVELGRVHAIVNNIEKAERALLIAVNLAPENRYVLRSLARFYIHSHQSDKALYYLRKSRAAKYDPWLISTQLSIITQTGSKSTHLIKNAFDIVDSKQFTPFDTNELASSLGTIELFSGASKSARKLFNQSLISPNDNSVAQASWASRHVSGLLIREASFKLPSAYEARAFESYFKKDYDEAFVESVKWLLDEPFASRAARFTSFLASTFIEDHEISCEISRFGLQLNPHSFDLLNNLAYSSCILNNVNEAKDTIDKINYEGLTELEKIVYTATFGLWHYRMGNPIKGKELYQVALKEAKEKNQDYFYRLALTNYVREEAILNPSSNDEIQSILTSLKDETKEEQIMKELEKIERILTSGSNLNLEN